MGKLQEDKLEALRLAATKSGWAEDRFGHLKIDLMRRTISGTTRLVPYRLKVQATSVRIEVGPSPNWTKVGGCYLSEIQLLERGGVQVGRHTIGADGTALDRVRG